MEHYTAVYINNLVLNSSAWVNHRTITLNKYVICGIPFRKFEKSV